MTATAANPVRKDRLERYRSVRARLDPAGDPAAAMASSYIALPHAVSQRIAAELALSPASSHLWSPRTRFTASRTATGPRTVMTCRTTAIAHPAS